MNPYKLTIVNYNDRLKGRLAAKTKVEPWLHMAVATIHLRGRGTMLISYAIYVWDTREVIEQGMIQTETPSTYGSPIDSTIKRFVGNLQSAVDNHEPLKVSKDNPATIAMKELTDTGKFTGVISV